MAEQHSPADEIEQTEVERLKLALTEIETRTEHQHCRRCGACLAHKALFGHFPSKRCCWGLTALRSSVTGRAEEASDGR